MARSHLIRSALVFAVAGACYAATPAQAADSLAPAGAPRTWLPNEPWVMEHWLPYDEGALLRVLHMSRDDVRRYFQGNRLEVVPPLAQIARRRGISPRRLAARLVRQWHPRVTHRRLVLLVDRATRSLTQGHLLQHMFFHPMHERALTKASESIFGATPSELAAALQQGRSRREVGHGHGRTDAQMHAATERALRQAQATGVRLHLTPPREAQRALADQIPEIERWLDERGKLATDPQAMRSRAMAARAGSGGWEFPPARPLCQLTPN